MRKFDLLGMFRSGDSLENPAVPLSADRLWGKFLAGRSKAAARVTEESAMSLPAVWAAVNFLSRTMASLPLVVYRVENDRRVEAVDLAVSRRLRYAPNPEMTSFQWRKYTYERLLTHGRAFSLIKRNAAGMVSGIRPVDPARVTVYRSGDRLGYRIARGVGGEGVDVYPARDVIDLVYSSGANGVDHYSPIEAAAEVIGQALEAIRASSRFYSNGGVPYFAIEGQFESAQSLARGGSDLSAAVRKAAEKGDNAMALPPGFQVKPIGTSPREMQSVQFMQYIVEQVARIYNIPPTMLQDLSKGTYSNTEQGDLHFAKHTVQPLCAQFEQELNLKLFGFERNVYHAEHSLEDLLKGDIKTHTESMARAIQSGQMTPNEARALSNRDPMEGGEELFMQSGTLPIGALPDSDAESVADPQEPIIDDPLEEEDEGQT